MKFRRNGGPLEALAAREAELRRERRLIDAFLHSTPDFVYFKARDSRFGVSFFPEDGDDAASLLRKADAAMYREKVRR